MQNKDLVNFYMHYNKVLMAIVDISSKSINIFDGEKNQTFNYKNYLYFLCAYYKIQPTFVEKGLVILNKLNKDSGLIEIYDDYQTLDGEPLSLSHKIIKKNDNEYIIFIRQIIDKQAVNLDQMTKANPKSFIDNTAKNNMISNTSFVLFYMDIDNFKHINDEYGQIVGDMILIEMVSVAKNILGNKGDISRIGGDRFLVIYNIDDDYDTVHDFLFDFKIQIQKLPVCTNRGFSITVTIGSSQFPSDGEYGLLQKKSMKALIRGKNKGRDCFIMYLEDKCGKVSLDEDITDKINKIDSLTSKNNVYSLITSINQVLSDDNKIDESVNKAINLIGNYFYVDRLSIIRMDFKTAKIIRTHTFHNQKANSRYELNYSDEILDIWNKALNTKKYVQIIDTKDLLDSSQLKKTLLLDHTTSTITLDLNLGERSFGLIRFDMTTGPRHWQPEDFQAFLLISQLFTSFFQKSYLKDTNYKTLYMDPTYECNNFSKLFIDTGEAIISQKISDYAIVEIEIRNIINFRSIIGKKKMSELVKSMVKIIENTKDVIYGKQHDGPFIVFLPYHDKNIIEDMIHKLVEILNKFTEINNLNDLELQSGIYLANVYNDSLLDALTNANLTRVLNRGEDFLYYTDSIREAALFRTEMVLRIDEALGNNEFLLYLQPKISTKTGELVGAEALTRWKYKHEKLLFPDQFIPLFEEQGIIEKLDFSVFENVCKYQKNLIEKNLKTVPISVNVSRYVDDFEEYINVIEKIRKKYNIPSDLIEIEITEGMYYENSSLIFEFINNLHKIGYKVSMDDFGAGYSNLVSMAKLNFDIIKFDRSFCINLDNDNVKIMLFKLIELVKTMHMHTICEGVETKENVEYLTQIGCDSIQGYYYSKPIPSEDFLNKYYQKSSRVEK